MAAEVKKNIVDKVVGYFHPSAGLKRQQARSIMARAGGYDSARRGRGPRWNPGNGSADADTLMDLPALRAQSSDLCRNNPLAAGAIKTKITSVIGSGLTLQSNIDREYLKQAIGMTDEQADEWEAQVEREWALFANSPECDLGRSLNFCGIQKLAYGSMLERGDVFAMLAFKERTNSVYGLKIQLIEADRLSNKDNARDSETLAGGVEVDANGAPKNYHIYKGHPGDTHSVRKKKGWSTVPAFTESGRRNVIHLHKKLRPGQTRGIPELSTVVGLLKTLGEYTTSEAEAALYSSFFTVFVETEDGTGLGDIDPETGEVGGSAQSDELEMGRGSILDLAPGEKVNFANPSRPNTAFDGFILSVLRQIGAALELPFEILIKHFTASYSASRASLIEAWRYFLSEQKLMEQNFCNIIYERLVEEGVARGRIKAPGFLNGDPLIRQAFLGAIWVGPTMGNLNPLQENKADALAEDRGWKTASQNSAQRGTDWVRNHSQRTKEIRMRREAELEPEMIDPNAPHDGFDPDK